MFKADPIVFTGVEPVELERRANAATSQVRVARRARVILLCADGVSLHRIGEQVDMSEHQVGLWRRRFLAPTTPRPLLQRALTRSEQPRPPSTQHHHHPTPAEPDNSGSDRWIEAQTGPEPALSRRPMLDVRRDVRRDVGPGGRLARHAWRSVSDEPVCRIARS